MTEFGHQRGIASRNTIFPFLDLPPEIRNNIYSLMATSKQGYNLENLVLPPIAKVSSKVRSEFLPIFFQGATFYYNIPKRFPDDSKLFSSPDSPFKFPPSIEDVLRENANKLFIKNITLRILEDDPEILRLEDGLRHKIAIFVRAERSGCDVWVERSPDYSPNSEILYWRLDGIDEIAGRVRDSVNDMAAREDFLGLLLGDLEVIGRCIEPQRYLMLC